MVTFFFFSIIGIAILAVTGSLLLTPLVYLLKKNKSLSTKNKKIIFVIFGTLLVMPSLAPAGTIMALPVPAVILFAFIRSIHDFVWFFKIWEFTLISFSFTASILYFISNKLFKNAELVT